MYYVALGVVNAAHAGAEYGSQIPTDPTGIAAAATAIDPNVTVTSTSWGSECSDGTSYKASSSSALAVCANTTVYVVQVTTQATYKMLVPWKLINMSSNPSTITFTKTVTMRGYNSGAY
jgi:hypothetical protein